MVAAVGGLQTGSIPQQQPLHAACGHALPNGPSADAPFRELPGSPGQSDEDQTALHWEASTATDSDDEDFMQQYSSAMGAELQASSLAQSFLPLDDQPGGASSSQQPAAGGLDLPRGLHPDALPAQPPSGSSAHELQPLDVDVNLVQSLLASYGAQEGLPGPAGNLAGALGLHLQQAARQATSGAQPSR